jgi:hypothetical protein
MSHNRVFHYCAMDANENQQQASHEPACLPCYEDGSFANVDCKDVNQVYQSL